MADLIVKRGNLIRTPCHTAFSLVGLTYVRAPDLFAEGLWNGFALGWRGSSGFWRSHGYKYFNTRFPMRCLEHPVLVV